jgi:hypothetical protein
VRRARRAPCEPARQHPRLVGAEGSRRLRLENVAPLQNGRRKWLVFSDLTCEKQKDAPDGWTNRYELQAVGLGDGQSSLVPLRHEVALATTPEKAAEIEQQILAAIGAAWDNGAPWGKSRQSRGPLRRRSPRCGPSSPETCRERRRDRRGFLRGLATLPLIVGGVALIGQPTVSAEPLAGVALRPGPAVTPAGCRLPLRVSGLNALRRSNTSGDVRDIAPRSGCFVYGWNRCLVRHKAEARLSRR